MKLGILDRNSVKVGHYFLGLDLDQTWREIHGGKNEYDAKIASVVCAPITKVEHEGFYWEDKTKTPSRQGYVSFPVNHHVGVGIDDVAKILDIPGVVLVRAPQQGEVEKLVSMPFLDSIIDSLLAKKDSVEISLS